MGLYIPAVRLKERINMNFFIPLVIVAYIAVLTGTAPLNQNDDVAGTSLLSVGNVIDSLVQKLAEVEQKLDHLETEVKARAPVPVRLMANGLSSTTGGWLQIFYNGQWGTVCDDWINGGTNQADNSVAQVVCRMMGRAGGRIHPGSENAYGRAGDTIKSIASQFRCNGDESNIFDCPFQANYGIDTSIAMCGHSEDLAITCD